MLSQELRILGALLKGKKITALDALNNFDSFRLSARIYNIRQRGYDVKSKPVRRNGKTVALYWLEEK